MHTGYDKQYFWENDGVLPYKYPISKNKIEIEKDEVTKKINT